MLRKLSPEMGQTKILETLMNDQVYKSCLKTTFKRYQIRKIEIRRSSATIYHELSKHAHTRYGNMDKLVISAPEHAISEVAALETVFCALKKRNCFRLPLTIEVE